MTIYPADENGKPDILKPIEGKGVDPLISVASKDWPQELFAYLHYQELVDAVKSAIENK